MSAQAKAKAAQGYVAKPVPATCVNCQHFRSERQLSSWMIKEKFDWSGKPYTIEEHGVDKEMRCGLGGFAVKKMGGCKEYTPP